MNVQDVSSAALQAMRAGRMDEAARLWAQVLAAVPDDPQALFHLAQYRMLQKDPAGAIGMLERAAKADPKASAIPLNIAFAQRALGNAAAELAAIERALAIDPYYLPALLLKGGALERTGHPRQAARVFRDALAVAPPDDQLSPELRKHVADARLAVDRNAVQLDAHLNEALSVLRASSGDVSLARFDACKEALLGRKKIYVQQPTMLHFPELPAIQFYDLAMFPWLTQLESQTDAIRAELLSLLESEAKGFRPYVQHPAGAPLNQWADLNYSPDWSAYFLWEDGQRNEAHCARCPQTAAVAGYMPLAHIPGYAPAVFFSTLRPHTRIPPHTGVTNIRLIVHLPLVVPEGCGFRVGNDSRTVEPGRAWVFDDTIEHEAWNDGDQARIILIFDIWNPHLAPAERELASALLNATRDYYSAG